MSNASYTMLKLVLKKEESWAKSLTGLISIGKYCIMILGISQQMRITITSTGCLSAAFT